jgi:hypothetical protein
MCNLHSTLLALNPECDTFVSRNHRSLTATLSLAGNSLSRRHHSEHVIPAVLERSMPVKNRSTAGSERSVLCSETSFCHKIWHKPFSYRNCASDFTWNFRSQFSEWVEFITFPDRTNCRQGFMTVIRCMANKLIVTTGYIRTCKHLFGIFENEARWFLMAIRGKLFAIRNDDVYYVIPISEAHERFQGP